LNKKKSWQGGGLYKDRRERVMEKREREIYRKI
jgi:hypothetical protein